IQGALAHRCAQCFHPYRSLQEGTAQVTINDDQEVDMIVVDGICMGHCLCAMPKCPNLPLNFHSKKLCAEHERSRGHLCGIVSC
ncbi:uncharacterized protein EI90DRAFT_2826382, partial [Cantharellus anzutake]|uniref:uncharacterized protein n=1 Tax=Cantharellus anzutake TaxID=1750568 RepID=UPI0019036AAB